MRYRLWIDGAVYYEPEFQITKAYEPEIYRDYDNRILRERSNMTFTAHGDLYKRICTLIRINSYCQKLECVLQVEKSCRNEFDNWDDEFYGVLDLSGIIAYVSPNCKKYFKLDLLDNSFQSRLLNRWNQKADVLTGQSLNGVLIQKPFQYNTIVIKKTAPFIDSALTYSVFDVMRFIVDFIFDGAVGFKSDFISSLNLNLGLIKELRLDAGIYDTFVSFKELFDELNVIYNLWIGFENGHIVVEQESYFRQEDVESRLTCLVDHEISIDTDKLYYGVEVGGETLDRADLEEEFPTYFENRRTNTWAKEEYAFSGECQSDNKLQLMNDYIIDSNIIEAVIENNDESYDEKLYLLECLNIGSASFARIYTTYQDDFYYNEGLQNRVKLENWFCGLDLVIGQNVGFQSRLLNPINFSHTFVGPLLSSQLYRPVYDSNIDVIFAVNFDFITAATSEQYTWKANTTSQGRVRMRICYTVEVNFGDIIMTVGYDSLLTGPFLTYNQGVPLFRQNVPYGISQNCIEIEGPLTTIEKDGLRMPFVNFVGGNGTTINVSISELEFEFNTVGNNGITYDPICSFPNIVHKFKKKITRDEFYSMRLNNRDSVILSDSFQTWIDSFKFDYKEQVLTGECRGHDFETECEIPRQDVVIIPPPPLEGIGWMIIEDTFIVG